MLFNDFEDSLNLSKSIQFADDTIYYSGKSVTNIKEMLNRDLSSISKYLKCKELIITLDKNKTETMLFGTAKRLQLNSKQLELYIDRHRNIFVLGEYIRLTEVAL